MNLPNKLTVLRLIMVPIIMVVMLLPLNTILWGVLSAIIFGAASFTDMLDGKIARRDNLITDFGKFLDPLADKFMVIGAMMMLIFRYEGVLQVCLTIAVTVVVFRELAVTSIRLVASGSGVVVAANMLGKIKTVSQIVFILCAMLEPVIFEVASMISGMDLVKYDYHVLTYASMAVSTFFAVLSGVNYLKTYWKFLDPEK
ncbi:MAG: CDP-diacylglycerol--glycerol-3-phosphate 3-phosphatidyltransferase [Clostridia bacterium]|nr:CDP-diacylglycerol--glycerol-3-phosphate 3-phosphatidyltransferase [Clostridia bacterium]MBQ4327459.1 CDP-diacylglycerol--glycerol-3-phosphate 3-phosphatidyltransferase [Clostridia bacterium]